MKKLLGGLLLLALSSPLYAQPSLLTLETSSSGATSSAPTTPANLTPDHVVRIHCGKVMGTAWPISSHVLVTAAHVTSHASVACSIPSRDNEKAYIANEDDDADQTFLYVQQPFGYAFKFTCEGYVPGETYYGAGWPRQGFTISKVTATATQLNNGGVWWHQYVLDGPDEFIPGQSGGPVVDKDGVTHGIVNGYDTEDTVQSYSRSLADTWLCRNS